jgi:hypothetical protein
MLSITVQSPPNNLGGKNQEVEWCNRAVNAVMQQFGWANGQSTSGTVSTENGAAQATWTYTPIAGNP